ncbi:MAG TPA: MFS transporter, partial [Methanoregulaceae archaeon]|nr:MFS transporter [Methanoregulaceae archaeon]
MPETNEQGTILAIATIASFFVPYLTSSITVALPAIGNEFALDAVTLGWVMSSYVLSTAICIVPLGRLADIYGRKRLFTAGIALLTGSCLLASFAWNVEALIAFRVLQGIGGAMIFTTSVAIVAAVFPPDKRGWALGITLASVYSGLSAGPFIGGILTGFLGWRSIFIVIVPLGLLVFWLTSKRISDEWIDAKGARFDLSGSILYGVALFGIMYGLTVVPDFQALAWIALGVATLAAFFWWEKGCISPVFDISVFRHNTAFTFSNLAAMINYAATYAVAFLLSLYLQYTKGFSPEAAGLILVAQPIIQVLFSPSAGRLSDRIEPRIVASTGMFLTTCGLLIFVFLTPETDVWLIVAVLVMLGFGYALFSSPNTNAIMSSVDRRYYGV